MNVFEITIPKLDNGGKSLALAHAKFQGLLLRSYGGYSSHDVTGSWLDAANNIYTEASTVYSVAVDTGQGDITALAEALFPDQLAFYVAHVGTAEVIQRGNLPSYAPGGINKEWGDLSGGGVEA